MRAAQAGDKEAYAQLLRRIEKLSASFVRSALATRGITDEGTAADVVQEILLAIHSKRATYDPEQFFLPWMYAIVRYKTIDCLRMRKRHGTALSIDDEWIAQQLQAPEAGAADSFDVESLLESLPRKQREIVRLVKLEGLTVAEASLRTGFSPSDIKVSVHRALKSLKKMLGSSANEV